MQLAVGRGASHTAGDGLESGLGCLWLQMAKRRSVSSSGVPVYRVVARQLWVGELWLLPEICAGVGIGRARPQSEGRSAFLINLKIHLKQGMFLLPFC